MTSTINYRFTILACLFTACLLTANIIAVKIVALPFGFFVPAGVVVFPLSYALNDVLAEVYGFPAMRCVIWLGFICNLVAVVFILLGLVWVAAPFWTMQNAYIAILGFTPRLLIASFLAYLLGQHINAYTLTQIKKATNGRYLWMRTISSTAIGEAFDTVIFISLAFYGILPLSALFTAILAQWVLKVVYEALATPFTYWVVDYLKKKEQV